MNQAEFHIRTEQDGVLALQQAVLIYRGAQGGAFATVHEVEEIDGEHVYDMTAALPDFLGEQLRQRRLHGHQHLFRKLRELAVEHVFPEFVRAAAILHEILADVGMGEERPEEGVVPRVDFLGGRTVRHAGAALADGATVIDVEVRRLKERRLRRGSRVSLHGPHLPHLTGCRKHQPWMRDDLPAFSGS